MIASMASHMMPLPPEQETALRTTPSDELLALPFLADVADPGSACRSCRRERRGHARVDGGVVAAVRGLM